MKGKGSLIAVCWALLAITVAAFVLLQNKDWGLWLLAVTSGAVLVGILLPVKFYGEKLTKERRKALSDFISQHEGQIAFCSHSEKRKGDIVIPVFCGFLVDGHGSYLLLEPQQDKQRALSFIQKLQELCFANNSWHLDCFRGRLRVWFYYRKAKRAFGSANG